MLHRIFGSNITRIIQAYAYAPDDAHDLAAAGNLEGLMFLMSHERRFAIVNEALLGAIWGDRLDVLECIEAFMPGTVRDDRLKLIMCARFPWRAAPASIKEDIQAARYWTSEFSLISDCRRNGLATGNKDEMISRLLGLNSRALTPRRAIEEWLTKTGTARPRRLSGSDNA